MWDFLSKKCGIFGIEGGTKLWDFQHRGGDFRPLTSGHTDFCFKSFFNMDVFQRYYQVSNYNLNYNISLKSIIFIAMKAGKPSIYKKMLQSQDRTHLYAKL